MFNLVNSLQLLSRIWLLCVIKGTKAIHALPGNCLSTIAKELYFYETLMSLVTALYKKRILTGGASTL